VDQCKGYKRLAFTIETAPSLYVPAFLLVPDDLDGPRPAILCSHGHGIGMNALVGLTEEGKERQFGQGYQHDFAVQAVRAGFVTLAFDQMGFGRRRDFDFNKKHNLWNACEHPSKTSLHWGLSMTGIRVYDAMRMIDFLQSRPEVDGKRIGMVGISGGGLVTQFTSALDDRIKAACVSGYCNRYESCILGVRHCIDNYVPGLGLIANNDDIACAIAPRPLLIESGTEDHIFPIDATRAAIRKLKRCYKLLDASGNFDADIFEAGHQFNGAKTWTFFKQHLGE
jgi:dienelactone hydrolase